MEAGIVKCENEGQREEDVEVEGSVGLYQTRRAPVQVQPTMLPTYGQHPCVVMRAAEGRKVQDARRTGRARTNRQEEGARGRQWAVGCGRWARCGASFRCAALLCAKHGVSCDPAFVHALIACDLRPAHLRASASN